MEDNAKELYYRIQKKILDLVDENGDYKDTDIHPRRDSGRFLTDLLDTDLSYKYKETGGNK